MTVIAFGPERVTVSGWQATGNAAVVTGGTGTQHRSMIDRGRGPAREGAGIVADLAFRGGV